MNFGKVEIKIMLNEISWTNENFDRFLIENKMNMIRLGNFKKISNPIQCQCNKCKRIWDPVARNVLKKHKCPKYAGIIKLTNENVDKIIADRNLKLIRMEDYKRAKHSTLWKCTDCQNTFKTSWDNIANQNKKGCGCKGGIFLLTPEYAKEKYNLEFRKIEIIELRPRREKSTFKCLVCEQSWDAIKGNVLKNNASGCPNCRFKKQRLVGELLRKYFPQTKEATLQNYKVVDPEFRIDLLKKRAFVDFKLTYNNKEYFIEYNGQQHYMPVSFGFKTTWEADDDYKKQILRDESLVKFANDKNIGLLILSYSLTDKQIEEEINQLKNNLDTLLCSI